MVFTVGGAWAKPVSILILGDSLSASYGMDEQDGWVEILQQRHDSLNIINASVSGETSGGALRRLPSLLDHHQPQWIFIELGGNDGLRGFAPTITQRNLDKIISRSQASGSQVLLSQVMLPPNYGRRYTEQFAQVFQTLNEQHQLTLVPFFMEPIAPQPQLMQADGIHPNKQAQPLIADFMEKWLLLATE
ncbi:arylesterase [uncultured Ferrimonas sp.]|uniref:arylesterase n=1 Tax=uncultured Ferrimonas sp. TaxID=432640 RepID=UPI00262C0EE7|nr:arylesterase [uncultured Ferrimonas sp.]